VPAPALPRAVPWGLYGRMLAVTALSLLLALGVWYAGMAEANVVMMFLLGVVFVSVRYGRGPGIAASMLAAILYDFLFVEPYYSFRIKDTEYLITFAVILVVALVISTLTSSCAPTRSTAWPANWPQRPARINWW
jgi:two-component system sensor histidine kinase KdpD